MTETKPEAQTHRDTELWHPYDPSPRSIGAFVDDPAPCRICGQPRAAHLPAKPAESEGDIHLCRECAAKRDDCHIAHSVLLTLKCHDCGEVKICHLCTAWHRGAPQETTPAQPERIVAAAIRQDGVVYTGPHHHQIIRYMTALGIGNRMEGQGFVTSSNRFVHRREALLLAKAAGQPVDDVGAAGDDLFSEQLWSVPDRVFMGDLGAPAQAGPTQEQLVAAGKWAHAFFNRKDIAWMETEVHDDLRHALNEMLPALLAAREAPLRAEIAETQKFIRAVASVVGATDSVMDRVEAVMRELSEARAEIARLEQEKALADKDALYELGERRKAERERDGAVKREALLSNLLERAADVVRSFQVRVAYIGMPQEPRGVEGQPTWAKQIALAEAIHVAIRAAFAADSKGEKAEEAQHVCGLTGFGQSLDDECPACRQRP